MIKKRLLTITCWIFIVRNWFTENEIENKTRVQILIQANLAKFNDGWAPQTFPWMKTKFNVWILNPNPGTNRISKIALIRMHKNEFDFSLGEFGGENLYN